MDFVETVMGVKPYRYLCTGKMALMGSDGAVFQPHSKSVSAFVARFGVFCVCVWGGV